MLPKLQAKISYADVPAVRRICSVPVASAKLIGKQGGEPTFAAYHPNVCDADIPAIRRGRLVCAADAKFFEMKGGELTFAASAIRRRR